MILLLLLIIIMLNNNVTFMFSCYGSKQATSCRGFRCASPASAAASICPCNLLLSLTGPAHTEPHTLRASHTICQGAHFNTEFPKGSLSPLLAWIW